MAKIVYIGKILSTIDLLWNKLANFAKRIGYHGKKYASSPSGDPLYE
jgi:hypothetical protein